MTRIGDYIRQEMSTVGPGRRASLILLLLVFFTAVVTSGWGYWTAPGSGTGQATNGTLNAPTSLAATATNGSSTVQLAWNGSTLSTGTPAQGYYLTRTRNSDSSTAAACGTSAASPTTATTCADVAVPDGTFHYTVTAVYNSWTATSTPSNDVTVSLPVQTVTWSPTTSIVTTQSPLTPSSLATTSGNGAITYSKVSNTTTTCSVNSSTAVLTYTGTGSCVVSATAAATSTYAQGTINVTFNISP